jgi:fibronectin-binding autotransporter adhesin
MNLGGGTIAASGSMSIAIPLVLTGSDGLATINNDGYKVTLSGPLYGPGGLIATGSGTLVLIGTGDTYTGETVVESGKLVVMNPHVIAGRTDLIVGAESTSVFDFTPSPR